MGIKSVLFIWKPDRNCLHVQRADEVIYIGAAPPGCYLNIDAIVTAGKITGADAVHPGYGFLSEKCGFCHGCYRARPV